MARAGQLAFRPGRALIAVIVASLLLSYCALELGILALGKAGRIPLGLIVNTPAKDC